jgi:formylglycine-generating enzyme required for sulfatase activity/acetyl esterase/lipase
MITQRTASRRLPAITFSVVLCLAALLLPRLPAHAQKPASPAGPTRREESKQREPSDPAKEIENLREEIRQLKAELLDQRGLIREVADYLTYAPETNNQSEDYAEARWQFQTKLLRKGPSPQPGSPLRPPEGVTQVDFPSAELHLKAWLNLPVDQSRKHAAVVFLHGGWSFYPGAWDQAKPYRDAGFIVITPMLRGENGQPGAFSYFYDEVDDVMATADYLRKQPYVDASRLFIAGHSNGGTMTMLAAMASNQYRAAASFDGAPYRPEFVTRDKTVPFDSNDPRETLLRSPIAYASSFKCPARIYYAADSKGSRFGNLRMAALAKKRGLDVEAVEIEGNHVTHVRPAMMQSIAFFQKISAEEIAPWKGELTPLPKTGELDLGNPVTLKFVRIEPGKFKMGSPQSEAERSDDEAEHDVEIIKPFGLGAYEVTQGQYQQVMGMKPSGFSSKGGSRERVSGLNTDDFPVEGNVSWEDAMNFCRVVSLLPSVHDKGWIVDLPWEAEWEYAARAGTETAFPSGNALSSEQENFNGNNPYGGAAKGSFLGRTARVGSYAANAWGLYDMLGNVGEWCRDWYNRDYRNRTQEDNLSRVVRGGTWNSGGKDCRVARRKAVDPTRSDIATGFRVVVRLHEK